MKILLLNQASHNLKLKSYLELSGFTVTSDESDFDFVLTAFDNGSVKAKEIADANSKYYPDPAFINKIDLEQKCIASNIAVLPTMAVSDLTSCTYPNFIIKPKVYSGGKHPFPWVYRIFSNSDIASVIEQIGEQDTSNFFVQKALIDSNTNETYLLFVDGVVNGQGQIHFNSISDKYMLNADSADSIITHKVGIRPVDSADKFGFKQKITTLIQDNNIHNTPFKAQAIVDVENNTCYINDWSWGIMPYTHLYVLDYTYLESALKFAYDINATVTKPIDKVIVMNHIEFPVNVYGMSETDFDAKYKSVSDNLGINRVEFTRTFGSTAPSTKHFILYGVSVDNQTDGIQKLTDFQLAVTQLG